MSKSDFKSLEIKNSVSVSFKPNKRAISEPIKHKEKISNIGDRRKKYPEYVDKEQLMMGDNPCPLGIARNKDQPIAVKNKEHINTIKESKEQTLYPKFRDNNISVKTYIVYTNLSDIEILKLYKIFNITRYIIKPKKRGRRKKGLPEIDYNDGIKNGSIISISDFTGLKAGIDIKPNRKKKKKGFKNALSIYMIIDAKPINIKICKNGKIQITGSKSINQAEEIIKYLWEHIKPVKNEEKEKGYNFENEEKNVYKEEYNTRTIIENGEVIELYNMNGTTFKAYFQSVMCNLTFKLGFNINKELLDKYITEYTEHKSLWGSSFGYTGVNIKFPNPEIKNDNIRLLTILNSGENNPIIKRKDISLDSFYKLNLCNENRKKSKDKYITFLVFHSGKVNMSSNDYSSMEDPYNEFIDIIKQCRDIIEIK